ncbi:MAG TPA: AAA family ATPase [Thermoanaerobaculales bacterium]|nr:AAA family ATPase [Thermoanaerobaculales bacterium]HQL28852.1 AAA family ATPase [Thermoanaerobaculales bacterium]HQP88993.1 AAA family ATPase [Thermoanaerobaculia bacterium]
MYVHEIRVKNYSIHKDTKVTLSPITVFVGPNGGGKSGLFDALLNFSMLSRGNIGQAFGQYPYSYAATKYRGASSVARIGFDVLMSIAQDSPERLSYRIDYSQRGKAEAGTPEFEIHTEKLESLEGKVFFDREDPDASPLSGASTYLNRDTGILAAIRRAEASAPGHPYPPAVVECAKQISRFNKFRLDPQNLGRPSALPDLSSPEAPRIEYEGENLAATLYFMSETGHPALDAIRKNVREALPGFDDFEFNAVGSQRIGFSVRFSDQRQTITAARLSDGQRLAVGLMALVYAPNRPPILMLEEPENGLTATVQRVFYRAIRELALAEVPSDRSQVLISSHSPFILCEAWNGEDRDFIHQVKIDEGRAVVKPFSTVVSDLGIHLARDSQGNRTTLGLSNAEQIMSGYLS